MPVGCTCTSMHRCIYVCLCADASMDNLGAVYFWHSHALISDATKAGLLAQCNFSTVGPLKVQIDSSGKVGPHLISATVCPTDVKLHEWVPDSGVCLASLVRSAASLSAHQTPMAIAVSHYVLVCLGLLPEHEVW